MTPRTLGPGRSHVAVARSDSGQYLPTISTPTQVGGAKPERAVLSTHEPDRIRRPRVLVGVADRRHADRRHRPVDRRARFAGRADLHPLVPDSGALPARAASLHAPALSVRGTGRLLDPGRRAD